MLIYPVTSLRYYLTKTEQYCLDYSHLFISTGHMKKSKNTISSWLRIMISEVYMLLMSSRTMGQETLQTRHLTCLATMPLSAHVRPREARCCRAGRVVQPPPPTHTHTKKKEEKKKKHPLLTGAVEMSEQRKLTDPEPGLIMGPRGCKLTTTSATPSHHIGL